MVVEVLGLCLWVVLWIYGCEFVFWGTWWMEALAEAICCARVDTFSVFNSGAAKLAGTLGILTRIAPAIFNRFDKRPLVVSRLQCFIIRLPFCILVKSFGWLRILASVDFSWIRCPRLLIYSVSLVFRSSLFPNFAISLSRTDTSNFPGSRMTEVNWWVFLTTGPGANTS